MPLPRLRPDAVWNRYNIPIDMQGCLLYAPLWQEDMRGTTFYSYDKNGHLLTPASPTWGSQGRLFDGDDKITITDPPVLRFLANAAFSVAAWVKKTTNSGSDAIATKYLEQDFPAEHFGWRLLTSNDTLAGIVRCEGRVAAVSTSSTTITTGVWYFFVMTFDNAGDQKIRLYIDNTEVSYATQTAAPSATVTDLGVDVMIGEDQDVASRPMDGVIGEVLIYNKVLSLGGMRQISDTTKWRYAL